MSAPELAALEEGVLDTDGVWALVADLEACAEVLDVLAKGGIALRADPTPVPLREAVGDMLIGRVRGIQVRYRYQGSEWRDTLITTPAGVRIVRMCMPG